MLQEFYSKYHDTPHGNYSHAYSDEEVSYFQSNGRLLETVVSEQAEKGLVIDLGCGEGWDLSAFNSKDWNVCGMDATPAGLKRCNPDLEDNFQTFDLSEPLTEVRDILGQANAVIMRNVLEHVLDPSQLISELHSLTAENTVFAFIVPNDGSEFQVLIESKNLAPKQHWMAYPDHLHYFSSHSLKRFLKEEKMEVIDMISDFHIEMDLLAKDSNYKLDGKKGKAAHEKRINFVNFLHTQPIENVKAYLRAQANLGLGRNVTAICRKI